MRIRALIFVLVFIALLPQAFAKKKITPSPTLPHATTTDKNYVSALNVANRFLQAWQAEDHEAGLLLITDSAKQSASEARLEHFFSPDATPQRAFQIAHGNKVKAGRYAFPVTLFENTPGSAAPHTRTSQMIVIQSSKDDWAVDKLP